MFYFLLAFLSFSYISHAERTRYIDANVQGFTIAESIQNPDYAQAVLWSNTSFDLDFHFNKHISIDTKTDFLNRVNGFTRQHARQSNLNGSNDVKTFFNNHGLTSRVLALNIHEENAELLVGKIRPSAAVGSSLRSKWNVFNRDWAGVYGTSMNGGYTNTNKVGLEFHSYFEMFRDSKQVFEIAFFKNNTTDMNDSAFSNNEALGFLIPTKLQNILHKPIAGDTSLPSSLSVLFIGQNQLVSGNIFNYSAYYRKQSVDHKVHALGANENTYIGSMQYERHAGASLIGTFLEIGYVGNAYGLHRLKEMYSTISGYYSVDKFTTALVYNYYTMRGGESIGINNTSLIQSQFSFGYKLNPQYRIDIAYRQVRDRKSGNAGQGLGLSVFYNIGFNNTDERR
ncbi:MAG: hypothetical protein ACI9CD_000788 [Candidatus Deianiraeaceae bacterium]|jgi:hypothetical protein